MKTSSYSRNQSRSIQTPLRACRWLALLCFLISLSPALAQKDDFNDGNDNGWIRRDVIAPYGGVNTYSFPDGPFGKALRIQCTSSAPLLGACGDCGTARAVIYRTNLYSDFYTSADIIAWNNDADQALVLISRATGLDHVLDPCPLPAGCPPGFGSFNGYICNYDANQDGSTPGDRRGGEFQINRVDNEAATTLAAAQVTLVPGRPYRMVLKGVGTRLTASIYDYEDLSVPIATISGEDSKYPAGVSGLISFSREGKSSDVTFDNYLASDSDPNADIAPAIRHPVDGYPVVQSRTPRARFTNFHPVSQGLSFTANTFSTNQINASAVRVYLNDQDVSSSLAPLPANGSALMFTVPPNALTSNTVYSARIELADTTGTRKSTNTFWFDTFTDRYLTNLLTIEAEDFNFDSGKFLPGPIPVSGFDTNGAQVGGAGVGYVDMVGTPDVDFHDARTSTESGWNDYRSQDAVGTIQGNREDIEDLLHPRPTTPAWEDSARPNDNTRAKYAAAGLREYEVARTQPGEWLNYTRVFPEGSYKVYLRVGSFGAQSVSLGQVTGDTTGTTQAVATLGSFNVPNQLMRLNYAYVPLTTASGSPAIVSLSGTNTLRLTFEGTQTKDNYLLDVNYMLFVPTAPQVGFFDAFNSGSDSTPPPAWTRYNPIATGSWSFPGGNTYRIQSAPSPDPASLMQGRAGSLAPGGLTDFYVSADMVGWDHSIHQVAGLLARISNAGPGTTTGYMFTHDSGDPASATAGDMDIVRLDGEVPTVLKDLTGNDSIHFETNKQYRLVFIGSGTNFTGRVYELPDTTTPVVEITAADEAYASGQAGLLVANNDAGSGFGGPADATFDNFLAVTVEPRLAISNVKGTLTLSWPSSLPFTLQGSPSLATPAWTPITGGVSQAGASNQHRVQPDGAAKYFRLVFPAR